MTPCLTVGEEGIIVANADALCVTSVPVNLL